MRTGVIVFALMMGFGVASAASAGSISREYPCQDNHECLTIAARCLEEGNQYVSIKPAFCIVACELRNKVMEVDCTKYDRPEREEE